MFVLFVVSRGEEGKGGLESIYLLLKGVEKRWGGWVFEVGQRQKKKWMKRGLKEKKVVMCCQGNSTEKKGENYFQEI